MCVLLYVQLLVYSAGLVMWQSKLCGHYYYGIDSHYSPIMKSRKCSLTCPFTVSSDGTKKIINDFQELTSA